jgi:hypothetical protein
MKYGIVDEMDVRDSRVNYPLRSQDLLVICATTRLAKYHSIRSAGASSRIGEKGDSRHSSVIDAATGYLRGSTRFCRDVSPVV